MLQKLSLSIALLLTTAWLASMGFAQTTFTDVTDYDNDGDLDIYAATWGAANVLYKNNGDGTFTDVTKEAGVGDSGATDNVAFGDYDNDGYLDIYAVNGAMAGSQPNVLYRNNGDGTFTDVTKETGAGGNELGVGGAFGDYDNDGYLDIYVSNGCCLQ